MSDNKRAHSPDHGNLDRALVSKKPRTDEGAVVLGSITKEVRPAYCQTYLTSTCLCISSNAQSTAVCLAGGLQRCSIICAPCVASPAALVCLSCRLAAMPPCLSCRPSSAVTVKCSSGLRRPLAPAIRKHTAVQINGATSPFFAVQGIQRTSNLQAPTMQLSGHSGEIYDVCFSPDGTCLASASFDKSVFCWRTYGDCDNYMVLRGHKNAVLQVHWFTDGARPA